MSSFYFLEVYVMIEIYTIERTASMLAILKTLLTIISVIYVPYVAYKVLDYLKNDRIEVWNNYIDFYNDLGELIHDRDNHILCLSNTLDEINNKLDDMEENGNNYDPDYIGGKLAEAIDSTLEWQTSVQDVFDKLSSSDVNRIHTTTRYRLAFLIAKVVLAIVLVVSSMCLPTYKDYIEMSVFEKLDTSLPFNTRVEITNSQVEFIMNHYSHKESNTK